ncbi:MAG: oligosaccharide flippase family protein [Acidobacteriota bacterium]
MKAKEIALGLCKFGLPLSSGGGFLRNVITVASGTVIGQGIVVLASPIITRLYDPADLGILAVYGSILSIFTVIASLRYEIVIPLPEEEADAVNILGLALSIVFITSLLVGGICLILGRQIADLVKAPGLRPHLWILPIGVGLIGAYQVFASWAVRKQSFGLIAKTKVNQGIGSVLTQVGLGILKIKPLGLLIGQVIGLASGSSTIGLQLLKQNRTLLKNLSFERMRRIALRYKRFPFVGAPAALLNSFTVNLPAILFAAFYGPQVAGWYAITQRAIGMPLNLAGQSIAQVYFGKAAPLVRSSSDSFSRLSRSLFLRLLFIGLLIMAPIVLIAPSLFVFVFGSKWAESGSYLPRLAPLFVAQFISLPFGCTLDILEQQGLFLLREIVRIALIILAFLTMEIFGLSARGGMTVLGIAGGTGYLVYILIAFYAIKKSKNA